ncbi:MAG: hypothetical protein ACK56I_29495, partial [bacterium]
MGDPRVCVEDGVPVVPDGVVGTERREGESPARLQRAGDAGKDGDVIAVRGHQSEGPLAQTDRRVELLDERQSPGVH